MADKLKTLTIGGVSKNVDQYKAGTNVTFSEVGADGKIAINANVDLSNYYNKTETDALLDDKADASTVYTKTETDTLLDGKQDTLTAGANIQITGSTISATDTTYTAGAGVTITNGVISADTGLSLEVVQTLPATGDADKIYLVPKTSAGTQNVYDEYIYTNNAWEKIGDTEVDLSNYYQKSETYSQTEVDNLLDDKQDTLTAGNYITIAQDGTISGNYTKSDILTILGYEEINMAMTDDNGVTNTWTILAKIPPTPQRTLIYEGGALSNSGAPEEIQTADMTYVAETMPAVDTPCYVTFSDLTIGGVNQGTQEYENTLHAGGGVTDIMLGDITFGVRGTSPNMFAQLYNESETTYPSVSYSHLKIETE